MYACISANLLEEIMKVELAYFYINMVLHADWNWSIWGYFSTLIPTINKKK